MRNVKIKLMKFLCVFTVCPRSSDPFYIVSYDIKWVTTSWTLKLKVKTSRNEKNSVKIELIRLA